MGTWVAQWVKHPTLDFSSGHDLMVSEFELHVGPRAVSMEPAWDFVSPPTPAPPEAVLSLSQNK